MIAVPCAWGSDTDSDNPPGDAELYSSKQTLSKASGPNFCLFSPSLLLPPSLRCLLSTYCMLTAIHEHLAFLFTLKEIEPGVDLDLRRRWEKEREG